jgi:hypothetical protein
VSVARIPARIVCPGCGKVVAAVPVDGGYRMPAHNRPRDADRYPGQTCEETPTVRPDRVVYETARP